MSHVREGELHAYLDGALDRLGQETAERVREHLATCEDCQSRVEQERDLREQVSVLLDRGLPAEIVAPPFEELLRRSAVGGGGGSESSAPPDTQRRFGPGASWRWAWAASLVMALGTGWMMGGGSLDFAGFADEPLADAVVPAVDRDAVEAPPQPEAESAPANSFRTNAGADREAGEPADVVDALSSRAQPQAPSEESVAQPRQAAATESRREDLGASPLRSRSATPSEQVADAEDRRAESPPAVAAVPIGRVANEVQDEADGARLSDVAVVDSFEDVSAPLAEDGGPLTFEELDVLALIENPEGGAAAVIQQLPAGDSVMLVWTGDARATAALQAVRLEEAIVASGVASESDAPSEVRRKATADADAGAVHRSLARSEPWPTVVRLRRGNALLVVYGTGTEAELRAALERAGLDTPGG